MFAIDALIGAGAVLVGGGLTYAGTSRDRQQRARDASEDRDFANRREACILLEAQRVRQLEEAEKLLAWRSRGTDYVPRDDYSDIQNPRTDAMVSLLLSDTIEAKVEQVNMLWSALVSSVEAIDLAEIGQPKINAFAAMNVVYESLKSASENLRLLLRVEARSKT